MSLTAPDWVAIKLTDLLKRVSPDVEVRVRRVRDQSRSVLQEALRTECRLVMRTPDEAENRELGAQVPVEIAPGYPAVLDDVVFPDELERILLLARYRASLERTVSGVEGLLRLREELSRRPEPEKWVHVTGNELQAVAAWANSLRRLLDPHDPLKTVLAIREDFLGVYQYQVGKRFTNEYAVNRATIRLYWGVIGLVADWMGVAVADLAVVVLTHELAHACTQLGADIEGRRWQAQCFAGAESGLKEGPAQYYTDRVLRRLQRPLCGRSQGFRSTAHRAARRIQGPPSLVREPLARAGSAGNAGSSTLERRKCATVWWPSVESGGHPECGAC
jgi:hypothetical protein